MITVLCFCLRFPAALRGESGETGQKQTPLYAGFVFIALN